MTQTPGPWRTDHVNQYGYWCIVSDGRLIAPNRRNAELLEAAPELLEALKDARDQLCSHPDFQHDGALDNYDAIIAKAEGRLNTKITVAKKYTHMA